ncbi:MAG: putative peptidoglycan glycosyltransferase FtsW [Anaerocolumna aminovalerica]|jgi:cell division protein FtsW|uniref:FtsW/RodA/SpoVE family cell cycle protein n=1 Tax=Anaerocolumna aminovalerica TaxID=1527 RepID=UPI000BE3005D|nr:putative peptidoglycan glycosyltransferase FtsW [Anaerocolumna aminovalerica]MBU5331825.1 putative lipid II flippase FtsW [Anaerocolumna aminovalerica]MDU6264056.1 putative peptidoglycan glycosyltransferase FtsW [Anaerocolumna aminovalerica]
MTRAEREQGKVKKFHSYYDYSLLFLTIFLVCIGLVMIYSTSSYNASRNYGKPTFYLEKQAIFGALGIIIMLIVSKIDYHFYIKKLPILKMKPVTLLFIFCILLQTYVLIFGKEINGAKRWIDLGPLGSFQPSELSKIAIILFTAYIVNLAPRKLDKFGGFVRVVVFVAPLIVLVLIPNFSTALVMGCIMIAICFVASRKKLYFIVSGIIAIGLGAIAVFGVSYRSTRIDVWKNVETHEKGYQILQGLYAIASGGIFGRGLGESMQKLGFIPESHNDMIFAVICEELGLFGAVAIILIFVLVVWRLFVIAINAPDLYGGLIATGTLTHIAMQVLLNIAVVTNTIPSTGIPLPFISYGGSSLVVLLIEMGIVLSVSNQIKFER